MNNSVKVLHASQRHGWYKIKVSGITTYRKYAVSYICQKSLIYKYSVKYEPFAVISCWGNNDIIFIKGLWLWLPGRPQLLMDHLWQQAKLPGMRESLADRLNAKTYLLPSRRLSNEMGVVNTRKHLHQTLVDNEISGPPSRGKQSQTTQTDILQPKLPTKLAISQEFT